MRLRNKGNWGIGPDVAADVLKYVSEVGREEITTECADEPPIEVVTPLGVLFPARPVPSIQLDIALQFSGDNDSG